ncbi:MAG: hypothetical protein MUF04_01270 [Akkermansiaceae bacterium]|nr:hypothetical protein [Akkermansiaceae bacterium]
MASPRFHCIPVLAMGVAMAGSLHAANADLAAARRHAEQARVAVTPTNNAVARCFLDGGPVRFVSFPRLAIDSRVIYP